MMKIKDARLFNLLIKDSQDAWIRIGIASSVAGIAQGGIVIALKSAASHIVIGGLNFRYLMMFAVLLAIYSVTSNYANSKTVFYTVRIIFDTHVRIASRIRNVDLRSFEIMGRSSIYMRLNTDTDIILETSKSFTNVFAGLVMIVFCAVYIAILSRLALLVIVIFYIFGILTYTSFLNRARPKLKEAARLNNDFLGFFKYFIEGFKEIKMNRVKGDDLYENYLKRKAVAAEEQKKDAERDLTYNLVFIQSFYYALIAGTIFLLPRISSLQSSTIVAIAVVVLFSYGSMTRIVLAIPMILKAEYAAKRIDDLESELARADDMKNQSRTNPLKRKSREFCLTLENIEFRYSDRLGDTVFSLGPIDAEIRSGELVLIVGSNGSGKSTLLKVIAGLYYPHKGNLKLNNMVINKRNYPYYRENQFVLFPDYYLFDRFYGMDRVDETLLFKLILEMGLGGQTNFVEGKFTNLNLSAGQRKRLALICSQMEDKEILIFDEIAADLDPEFRKFFYEIYLQKLTTTGKTVIAVSHDERYFNVADKIIRLEYGRIENP